MTEFVQIKSPDGEIGSCSLVSLPIWEAKGYTLHEPKAEPVEAPTNDDPAPVRPPTDIEVAQRILDGEALGIHLFDPTERTVSEILDYLAKSDDIERARVIDAERVAKARATVLRESRTPIVPATTTDHTNDVSDDVEVGDSTAGAGAEQHQDDVDPTVSDPDPS
jgi:hypothetical protein